MPANYDSSANCPHCSRASYAGHHPDCPDHPDKQPKPVSIDSAKFDALKAAWVAVPNGVVVPDRVAGWLQPLINACTDIVDPTGELGATGVQSVTEALGDDPDAEIKIGVETDATDPVETDVDMAARVDKQLDEMFDDGGAESDPAKPE